MRFIDNTLNAAAVALERYNYTLLGMCRNPRRQFAAHVSTIVDSLRDKSMSPERLIEVLDSLADENRHSNQPDDIETYIQAVYDLIQRRMLNPFNDNERGILFYAHSVERDAFPVYLEALSFLEDVQKFSILNQRDEEGSPILERTFYCSEQFISLMSIVRELPIVYRMELLHPAFFIDGDKTWRFSFMANNVAAVNAFIAGIESTEDEHKIRFLTFQKDNSSLLTKVLECNTPKLAAAVIALIDRMEVSQKAFICSSFMNENCLSLSAQYCPEVLESLLALVTSCYPYPVGPGGEFRNSLLIHAAKDFIDKGWSDVFFLLMNHIESNYDEDAIASFLMSSEYNRAVYTKYEVRFVNSSKSNDAQNTKCNILELASSEYPIAFVRLLDTVSRLPAAKRFEILINSPMIFTILFSSNEHLDHQWLDDDYILPLMRVLLSLEEQYVTRYFTVQFDDNRSEPKEPNPLFFHIVCKFPTTLSYLLTAFRQPPFNDMLINLLLTVDDDGRHLLMRIADKAPMGLSLLLAEIQQLNNQDLNTRLLSQLTHTGETLVSYAISRECWSTLPFFINFIVALKEDPYLEQTTIYDLKVRLLKQVIPIFIHGLDDRFTILTAWLEALEQLDYIDRLTCFQQVISRNSPVLLDVCSRGLVRVSTLLLDFVMKFNNDDRNAILLQRDDRSKTILSWAMYHDTFDMLDLILNKLQSYPEILLGMTDRADTIEPVTQLQQMQANKLRLLAFIDTYYPGKLSAHITEVLNKKQDMLMVPVFKDTYEQLSQFLQKIYRESMEQPHLVLSHHYQLATIIELCMGQLLAKNQLASTAPTTSMSHRFFRSGPTEKIVEQLRTKIQQLCDLSPLHPIQIIEKKDGKFGAQISAMKSEAKAIIKRLMERDELDYKIKQHQGITCIHISNLEADVMAVGPSFV